MTIAALVEPTVLVAVYALSIPVGTSALSAIVPARASDPAIVVSPVSLLAVVALAMAVIAETGRLPVDNPATHLELTMVHEAMVLESSGRDLAWLELGSWLRLTALLGLVVNLVVPWGVATTATLPAVLVGLVAIVRQAARRRCPGRAGEVFLAKVRLFRVPRAAGRIVRAGVPGRDRLLPGRMRGADERGPVRLAARHHHRPAAAHRRAAGVAPVADRLDPAAGRAGRCAGRAWWPPSASRSTAPRSSSWPSWCSAIKAVAMPWALTRTARVTGAVREESPLVNPTAGLLVAAVLTVLAYVVAGPDHRGRDGPAAAAVPIGLALVLIGFLVMLTRRSALSQLIGFVMLDNGIATVAFLTSGGVPLVVELGVTLDVLLVVLILRCSPVGCS